MKSFINGLTTEMKIVLGILFMGMISTSVGMFFVAQNAESYLQSTEEFMFSDENDVKYGEKNAQGVKINDGEVEEVNVAKTEYKKSQNISDEIVYKENIVNDKDVDQESGDNEDENSLTEEDYEHCRALYKSNHRGRDGIYDNCGFVIFMNEHKNYYESLENATIKTWQAKHCTIDGSECDEAYIWASQERKDFYAWAKSNCVIYQDFWYKYEVIVGDGVYECTDNRKYSELYQLALSNPYFVPTSAWTRKDCQEYAYDDEDTYWVCPD